MRARRDFSHIERPVGVRGIKFRSKMEANYAAYLEWLLSIKQIAGWDYEPMTFWFTPGSLGAAAQGLAGVRRGVTSCKLDFRVRTRGPLPKGDKEWHEVKGWFDPRSRTVLKRMKLYYPEEKVIVIDSKQIAALRRQVGAVVPGWVP